MRTESIERVPQFEVETEGLGSGLAVRVSAPGWPQVDAYAKLSARARLCSIRILPVFAGRGGE
jgi:hypothetical protein